MAECPDRRPRRHQECLLPVPQAPHGELPPHRWHRISSLADHRLGRRGSRQEFIHHTRSGRFRRQVLPIDTLRKTRSSCLSPSKGTPLIRNRFMGAHVPSRELYGHLTIYNNIYTHNLHYEHNLHLATARQQYSGYCHHPSLSKPRADLIDSRPNADLPS